MLVCDRMTVYVPHSPLYIMQVCDRMMPGYGEQMRAISWK